MSRVSDFFRFPKLILCDELSLGLFFDAGTTGNMLVRNSLLMYRSYTKIVAKSNHAFFA
jgi:hypothetical protein